MKHGLIKIILLFAGPPSAPIGPIKTIHMTRDTATIQWKPPADDGGSPITGYVLEKREASKRAWVYFGRTDPEVTTHCVLSLMEGHNYHFRVYAENKYGRSEPLDTESPITPKKIFGKLHRNLLNKQA